MRLRHPDYTHLIYVVTKSFFSFADCSGMQYARGSHIATGTRKQVQELQKELEKGLARKSMEAGAHVCDVCRVLPRLPATTLTPPPCPLLICDPEERSPLFEAYAGHMMTQNRTKMDSVEVLVVASSPNTTAAADRDALQQFLGRCGVFNC